MLSIAEIRKPISAEIQIFNEKFVQALATDNPLLNTIHNYVLEGSGKQLRPILTLLSAKLCGEINEVAYDSAISVEMLHNASLIHDDVVDDTSERRGRKSINSRWTNKIAVLSGDYMLANALMRVVHTKNFEILREITQIGLELSDGELAQLANAEKSITTEEDYFAIIHKKTAVLFSTCCTVGAMSAGANAAQVENLRNFGKLLGLCFQIKDDIFDYFPDIEIGKPTGNDLQDGKITLPLIYALTQTTENEREKILEIITGKNFTPENIECVMEFARRKGGIDYAEKRMLEFASKAVKSLSAFPECTAKEALADCVKFACERKS